MAAFLQLAGMAGVVAGAALIAPAAGLIVGGIFLLVLGVAVERVRVK